MLRKEREFDVPRRTHSLPDGDHGGGDLVEALGFPLRIKRLERLTQD